MQSIWQLELFIPLSSWRIALNWPSHLLPCHDHSWLKSSPRFLPTLCGKGGILYSPGFLDIGFLICPLHHFDPYIKLPRLIQFLQQNHLTQVFAGLLVITKDFRWIPRKVPLNSTQLSSNLTTSSSVPYFPPIFIPLWSRNYGL